MPFKRTHSILTNDASSDVRAEADVIMTSALLGFAASHVAAGVPIRFDLDPLDGRDARTWERFKDVVNKIDAAVARYLREIGRAPAGMVDAGTAPDYTKGAVIMGIYQLAGQTAPVSMSDPQLSHKGRALYDAIVMETLPQYLGRGAYTGFVDNWNTEGATEPVGPRSTARFVTPIQPGPESAGDVINDAANRRWLPPADSPLWNDRLRRDTQDSFVPWGIIGGDKAQNRTDSTLPNATDASNLADQITIGMRETYRMAFVGREPTNDDIVGYTHGMIQAIYKAYSLGPSCKPYEIAVGGQTKKMASCLPCTFFMVAQGYPPNSTHLGRGESWTPLYQPYNPSSHAEDHESAVIRDLNNSWCVKCNEYMQLGSRVLATASLSADHLAAADSLFRYLDANASDRAAAANLILDALTMHESESIRVDRTL